MKKIILFILFSLSIQAQNNYVVLDGQLISEQMFKQKTDSLKQAINEELYVVKRKQGKDLCLSYFTKSMEYRKGKLVEVLSYVALCNLEKITVNRTGNLGVVEYTKDGKRYADNFIEIKYWGGLEFVNPKLTITEEDLESTYYDR